MVHKKKGRTSRYIFNYPRFYGPIFRSGTTIVRSHIRKNPLGGRTVVRKHRRRA